MFDNKWNHGKVHLDLSFLQHIYIDTKGIKPVRLILDSKVGEEMVLLISESKRNAQDYHRLTNVSLNTKVGLVHTSYGPVCFLLFYFPYLPGGQATYENIINPKDFNQIAIYERLGLQKYWHVIIADDVGNVVNFLELSNTFGLFETLQEVKGVCSNMKVTDFMAAKSEYMNEHTIEELLNI
ncbi:MAG TPA: hypothetical protein VFG54_00285 [Prolixibacteraceae bacterium]|nr:hypothetical protein [Prolixibacteraceae bacterium]